MAQLNYYQVGNRMFVGRTEHVKLVSRADIFDAVRKAGSQIRAGFFDATAVHETNRALNEVDLELTDQHKGFVSRGPYQVSDGWGRRYGGPLDLTTGTDVYVVADDETIQAGFNGKTNSPKQTTDLVEATVVFSRLQQIKLNRIIAAWRMTPAGAAAVELTDDIYAYLALAHNEGLEAALKTIALHGADWGHYKVRNGACQHHWAPGAMASGVAYGCGDCSEYIRHIGAYGDDCMEG